MYKSSATIKKFNIEKDIIIRTKNAKYGFDEKKIWKYYFKNIKLDIGKTKITELYEKSKIIIHTSIGTSYLETLRLNIPTIIYHKLDGLFEQKNSIIFKEVKKRKIFLKVNMKHLNILVKYGEILMSGGIVNLFKKSDKIL